ncbi:PilZ domain-containing protein [Sphingomonas faeni]|uniref:PilZ domain-containing protein n=1 Tax=Sphingomonas faeni TaxID=185950 RepID=UPI0033505A07
MVATAHNLVSLADTIERRADTRVSLARTGTLRLADAPSSREVRIADLNRDGCRVESILPLSIDQAVTIGIPGIGQNAARITWVGQWDYGCQFDTPLPAGSVTAAMTDNVHDLGYAALRAPATFKWAPRGRLVLLGAISLAGWTAIAVTAGRLLG